MVSGALNKISKLYPLPYDGQADNSFQLNLSVSIFFVMQIRVIFALPSLVPPLSVPWAAAPVAYPSIHHWVDPSVIGSTAVQALLLRPSDKSIWPCGVSC